MPAEHFGALPAGLGRDEIVAAVREALDATVPPGAGVVIALSGGPDSTALAYLVTQARPDLRPCVAHVRHGLRDDAEDAAVARTHAAALGLAFHECRVDVRPGGQGPEAAARQARYSALSEVAHGVGAAWVLVGHTADDQAETLLLNLARGAGTRGLAAMAPVRGHAVAAGGLMGNGPAAQPPVAGGLMGNGPAAQPPVAGGLMGNGPAAQPPVAGGLMIVRPLLRVRRADVRDFVVGQGLAAVADPTNHDPEQRRARVRSEVLPALARLSGGPGDPVGVLCRHADLARDDADALDTLAAEQARRLVVAWGPVRAVRSGELQALSPALARRVVRLLLAEVRGRAEGLTADAVRAVLTLPAGRALHVPGGAWVTAGGGWLAGVPPGTPDLPERPLRVPGTTVLPELGLALHADRLPAPGDRAGGADGWPPADPDSPSGACGLLPPRSRPPRGPAARPWAVLPAEVAQGLVVRARRTADRAVLPYGTRTLADLLVDLGVPRAARGLVPVVAGVDDQPAWVPGVAVRACGSAPAPIRLWIAPLQ